MTINNVKGDTLKSVSFYFHKVFCVNTIESLLILWGKFIFEGGSFSIILKCPFWRASFYGSS